MTILSALKQAVAAEAVVSLLRHYLSVEVGHYQVLRLFSWLFTGNASERRTENNRKKNKVKASRELDAGSDWLVESVNLSIIIMLTWLLFIREPHTRAAPCDTSSLTHTQAKQKQNKQLTRWPLLTKNDQKSSTQTTLFTLYSVSFSLFVC